MSNSEQQTSIPIPASHETQSSHNPSSDSNQSFQIKKSKEVKFGTIVSPLAKRPNILFGSQLSPMVRMCFSSISPNQMAEFQTSMKTNESKSSNLSILANAATQKIKKENIENQEVITKKRKETETEKENHYKCFDSLQSELAGSYKKKKLEMFGAFQNTKSHFTPYIASPQIKKQAAARQMVHKYEFLNRLVRNYYELSSNEQLLFQKALQIHPSQTDSSSHHNSHQSQQSDDSSQQETHPDHVKDLQNRSNFQFKDSSNHKKCCNCKKTGCLKLYCECFRAQKYCTGNCSCELCKNTPANEEIRRQAKEYILMRNPYAFSSKVLQSSDSKSVQKFHSRGCNCKKSGCSKKYCECYQMGVPCTNLCRCVGCKNNKQIENTQGHRISIDPNFTDTSAQPNSASSHYSILKEEIEKTIKKEEISPHKLIIRIEK